MNRALRFISLTDTQPAEFEVVMAARGLVKVAEYHLLWFRKNHDVKRVRGKCKQVVLEFKIVKLLL